MTDENAETPPTTWAPTVHPLVSGPVIPVSAETFLFTIGDIGVSPSWVVTPNGSAPLRRSQWLANDMSRIETKIPTWAIIMAILFIWACFIGLLFLLAKETRTSGYVDVTVRSDTLQHTTQVPISNTNQVLHIRQMVGQAQAMAATLG